MDHQLGRRIVQALMNVPATASFAGRTALLFGLPPNVSSGFNREPNNQFIDLTNLIPQLDALGRLTETGERPLIIVAQNAQMQVAGTDAGQQLNDIIDELETYYGGDAPRADIPPVPEVLVFEGRDERLPYTFIQQAERCAWRVARLYIPRYLNGQRSSSGGVGTAWLIGPELLLTNHHVVAARQPGEAAASAADLRSQAQNTVAWFDYRYGEAGARAERRCADLVHSNAQLDYALLRLHQPELTRQPLPLLLEPPILQTGDRLNIVQHPRGGPLRYAIRNNFYVGAGDTADYLRYLTDTEPGSSGSPILNDEWRVVGMHRGYREVPETEHRGEVTRFHNEGVVIHAILDDLPAALRDEIVAGQEPGSGAHVLRDA